MQQEAVVAAEQEVAVVVAEVVVLVEGMAVDQAPGQEPR